MKRTVTASLPVKIVSEQNRRDHHMVKARRVKGQRSTARLVLLSVHPTPATDGHIHILLTRVANRKLDDDNLVGAFKAVRDGVSDWLRIDDGSPRLHWRYAQRQPEGRETEGATVAVEWVQPVEVTA